MAGPGGQTAAGAGGRGHVRAAHADREQVIETLKTAFAHGRLDKDEFDLRMSRAFASRTYGELAAVTAGLPPARPAAPARAQAQPARWPGAVLGAATALYAGAWVLVPLYPPPQGDDNALAGALVFLFGPIYLVILTFCVGQMLALCREKRPGGQLPRPPATGQRPA